jgi:lysozyme family protein
MQPSLSISVCVESGNKLAEFAPAFQFMIAHEEAHRGDPGKVTRDGDGRTRFGICEKFHPEMPAAFWTCPDAKALAIAQTIYVHKYFDGLRLGEITDQAVASKILDLSVVMGIREATVLAQRAANGLLLGSAKAPSIDGKMGDHTIAALNACPPQNVVETLCNLAKINFCEDAVKNPAKQVDLAGWLVRAAAVPPSAAPVAEGASA